MSDAPRDLLRDAYVATLLEIRLLDGRQVTVAPRPLGVREGSFPTGVERIHVITASNPRSQPLLGPENATRNELLRRELHVLVGGPRCSSAVGRSADGRWSEDSFAVFDAPRRTMIDLATRHGQLALYEWTAATRAVVWTAPERADDVHGWAVGPA